MAHRWRLIDTSTNNGYFNMALDEALMLHHYNNPEDTLPTLRFYRWSPACFSLGYFQKPGEEFNMQLMQKDKVPFVKRLTGGAIIYHDQELTYSMTCFDHEIPFKGNVKESFKFLCGFIKKTYEDLKLEASFAVDKNLHSPTRYKTSLCFAEREQYDILIGNKKIGGNAQKRKKHLLLQHGSIPLSFDYSFTKYLKKPDDQIQEKICALKDLAPSITYNQLKELLKKSFQEIMNVELKEESLSEKESNLVQELTQTKYKNPFKD